MDYRTLIETLKIKLIIVFGNIDFDSKDIDLLIVSDDFSDMFYHKRINKVLEYIESDLKLDPICLTQKEYNKLLNYPNEFAKNIIDKGELIYER